MNKRLKEIFKSFYKYLKIYTIIKQIFFLQRLYPEYCYRLYTGTTARLYKTGIYSATLVTVTRKYSA